MTVGSRRDRPAANWLKSGAGAGICEGIIWRTAADSKLKQKRLAVEWEEEHHNNHDDNNNYKLPKDHPISGIKRDPNNTSHSAAQSSQPTSSHLPGVRYLTSLGFTSIARDYRPLSLVFMFSLSLIQLFATTLAITTPTTTWHHYRTDYDNQMRLPWATGPAVQQPSKLIIPSARHVYTTSLAPQNGDNDRNQNDSRRNKILFLHSQLNQLKHELDVELGSGQNIESNATETATSKTSAPEDGQIVTLPPIGKFRFAPVVTLGSPCLSSSYCSKSIRNSQCNLDTFTCTCLSEHVRFNSTTCLAPSLLGYECQLDGQCQQRVPESVCQSGRCACPANAFVPYRKNKCLSASKLNDYCLLDSQCQLNDRHSFCKWKIHNIYGTCKCPPNYKLLSDHKNNPRCVPRLGDSCLNDQECQLATANSICKSQATEETSLAGSLVINPMRQHNNKWQTSSASSNRCTCSSGFERSHNQLDCVPIAAQPPPPPPPPPPPLLPPSLNRTTNETGATNKELAKDDQQQKDTHKYEMIVMPGELEKAQPTTTVTTGTSVMASTEQQRPPEIVVASEREELEIKVMPMESSEPRRLPLTTTTTTTTSSPSTTPTTTTTTTTTTERPQTTSSSKSSSSLLPVPQAAANVAGFNNQTAQFRMSSLGKPCRSRQECQARDPFSDCIAGVCECLAPSERCRASRTGCHPDTFQCRNGQCISWYFVCDQFKNCDDGSDEDDCKPRHCPREAFQCQQDGACLTKGKVCNGKRDCLDGSDELNCEPTKQLQQQQQPRPQPTTAMKPIASANNSSLLGCHPDAFTCSNGQCLPGYVFCNAVQDCTDGSDEDELVCERQWPVTLKGASASLIANQDVVSGGGGVTRGDYGTSAQLRQTNAGHSQLDQESPLVNTDRASIERLMASLTLGQWTPEGRGRIKTTTSPTSAKNVTPIRQNRRKSKLLIDGAASRQQDALVGRARSSQSSSSPTPPDECPRWAFTCRNGKCRSSAILCSGVDGCGDNSDEDQCEVCQCEAPPAVPTTSRPEGGGAGLVRATNLRRRNRWTTSGATAA